MAEALRAAAEKKQTIRLEGAGSKRRMGGPPAPAEVHLSAAALDRLIGYDPRDLTISVEAGMPWRVLTETAAAHRQMIPLDPPGAAAATVGGVVAANCSGPRRRLYGAARDQVIGVRAATLDGALIQSGGMVVKNVAGYDLQKLLTGSFGTLAALVSVNFKLAPMPEAEATFALAYPSAEAAAAACAHVLRGALIPSAIELLNPAAAARFGLVEEYVLLVRAGGNSRVLDRFARELPGASRLEGEEHAALWRRVEDFAPDAAARPEAAIVRAGFPMQSLAQVMALAQGPAVARAGNGLAWLEYPDAASAAAGLAALQAAGAGALIEWTGDAAPADLERWPDPGPALDAMREVKKLFDPLGLLNPGRLHGRI